MISPSVSCAHVCVCVCEMHACVCIHMCVLSSEEKSMSMKYIVGHLGREKAWE